MQVQLLVTVDVDDCDGDTFRSSEKAKREAAVEAIANAIEYGEANGFSHLLANDVSIGVVAVELLIE